MTVERSAHHNTGWGFDFLTAFRNGEEQAFDQVFRTYYRPLTFFAFKYLHDEKLAEDIVQDCFAELWERRKKLSQVQSISSYLYRCVYNHCAKWLDRHQRTSARTKMPPEPESANIIESEVLTSILQTIECLPARMKQVVKMYYLEEKSLQEIGATIGIDAETARSHRYRAIRLIRKTIITN